MHEDNELANAILFQQGRSVARLHRFCGDLYVSLSQGRVECLMTLSA